MDKAIQIGIVEHPPRRITGISVSGSSADLACCSQERDAVLTHVDDMAPTRELPTFRVDQPLRQSSRRCSFSRLSKLSTAVTYTSV